MTEPAAQRSELVEVEEPASTAEPRVFEWRRVNMLVPGGYAWVTTVAYPATYREAHITARIAAGFALAMLVAGPLIAHRHQRAGRAVGVFGFLAFSVVAWLLLGSLISVDRLDPIRAASGAIAWALFAFAWGNARRVGHVPEEDPHVIEGTPMEPRGSLPVLADVVFAVGLLLALIPPIIAWRELRSGHALLAHGAAMLCAIAMVSVAARVAVDRSTASTAPRAGYVASLRPLALATVLLAAGAAWTMLR